MRRERARGGKSKIKTSQDLTHSSIIEKKTFIELWEKKRILNTFA